MASLTQKLRAANERRLDLSSQLSRPLHRLINCHADALGVPEEFILYPLITSVAACIGVNGHIRINPTWVEPSILWLIVAAKKGEKKTAALRVIRRPFERLQDEIIKEWKEDISDDKPQTPPQLLVDNFSFEELHCILKRNGHQALGMFDEMSSFYAQLDLFKHTGSDFDKKTLISLNGGGAWTRNFRSYSATLPKTAFNFTGFIQPAFVEKMVLADDPAGFVDRQLFDFPPERDMYLDDLKVPVPEDIPDLEKVLKVVMDNHKQEQEYTLEGPAYDAFREAHDQLVDQKQATDNENLQGIYAKSRGYVARLAMAKDALEQAVSIVIAASEGDQQPSWSYKLMESSVKASAAIVQHLNGQKEIMMGLKQGTVESQLPQYKRVPRLLLMKTDNQGHIAPSAVAQKHICIRYEGAYTVEKALELFKTTEELGFGQVIEIETPVNRRRVKRFSKARYDNLTPPAKRTLQEFKITERAYCDSFATATTEE